MHLLNRTTVAAPRCLSRYHHGRNTWSDLTDDDRQEIRNALETMQGRRCAYCECSLDEDNQHIEHFRQRGRYPQGIFDWENLFWSCIRTNSCGKHKDGCGSYNHADPIKPDVEDPERFFLFIFDGSIAIRKDLIAEEQHRAKQTLRIFNLDEQWGALRQMRRSAVAGYVETLKELEELSSFMPQQEIVAYIDSEYAHTRHLPFCTAIKHVLTPQGITL